MNGMYKKTKLPLTHINASLKSFLIKGYMPMVIVLLIWSGFSLTARAIGSSALTIADVALIRFAVPAILLTPFIRSHFNEIKNMSLRDVPFLLLGGIPFLFLASLGAHSVPTAYVGAIIASTPVLFVAILTFFIYGKTMTFKSMLSLFVILLGVFIMLLGQPSRISHEMIQGMDFLFGASFVWASYCLGIKRAGLSSIAVAMVVSYVSLFIMLVLMLSGVVATNWGTFTLDEAFPFILVQGVGVGFLATICFSYSIAQLGAVRTSVLGSISPGITAILALVIFGESLTVLMGLGIAITIYGVITSHR